MTPEKAAALITALNDLITAHLDAQSDSEQGQLLASLEKYRVEKELIKLLTNDN